MGFSGRERYLIIGVLLCLGAWLGDRLVASPLYALWNERAAEIRELERSLEKHDLLAGRQLDACAR